MKLKKIRLFLLGAAAILAALLALKKSPEKPGSRATFDKKG